MVAGRALENGRDTMRSGIGTVPRAGLLALALGGAFAVAACDRSAANDRSERPTLASVGALVEVYLTPT